MVSGGVTRSGPDLCFFGSAYPLVASSGVSVGLVITL